MAPHATESEIDIARYEDEGSRIRPMGASKPSDFVCDGRINRVSEFDYSRRAHIQEGRLLCDRAGRCLCSRIDASHTDSVVTVLPRNYDRRMVSKNDFCH